MPPSRRVLNPGILLRMVLKIRHLAGVLVFGLTKHGILVSQQARGHIFGAKQNRHYLPGATSTITGNSSLDRTPVSRGIICKFGRSFTRRGSKCQTWEMWTPSLITSKQNTSLHRSSLALFAGTSNYSAQSATASVVTSTGVQTSKESTSRRLIASRLTRR